MKVIIKNSATDTNSKTLKTKFHRNSLIRTFTLMFNEFLNFGVPVYSLTPMSLSFEMAPVANFDSTAFFFHSLGQVSKFLMGEIKWSPKYPGEIGDFDCYYLLFSFKALPVSRHVLTVV